MGYSGNERRDYWRLLVSEVVTNRTDFNIVADIWNNDICFFRTKSGELSLSTRHLQGRKTASFDPKEPTFLPVHRDGKFKNVCNVLICREIQKSSFLAPFSSKQAFVAVFARFESRFVRIIHKKKKHLRGCFCKTFSGLVHPSPHGLPSCCSRRSVSGLLGRGAL